MTDYIDNRKVLPFSIEELRYANFRETLQNALLNPNIQEGAKQFQFAVERYGDISEEHRTHDCID